MARRRRKTTWAIGTLNKFRAPTRVASAAGFTLLELLVVLLIVGITLGFMALNLNPHRQAAAEEGERLGALLTLAKEEAILNGGEWAWEVEPSGYRFLRLDGERWQAVDGDETFRPRLLPAGLTVSLTLAGETIPLTAFSAGAAKEEKEIPPRLYLFSSGEATPAWIELVASELGEVATVHVSAAGVVSWGGKDGGK